jgi:4-amino-4-deoxy-L-arabinose transferase-like glycosyltransferase
MAERSIESDWRVRLAVPLSLIVFALLLTLPGSNSRGAMWPDSPRYANAGAMIHDWLRAGEWTNPLRFAEQNYYQYPAMNIPYHPPGYPGMLGVLFLFTGVSYFAVKLFVAGCWAGSGLLFFVIQRRFNLAVLPSWLLSLVFLSTPELLHWSRDTMSEIPALFFLLASTLAYLTWLDKHRVLWLMLAFGLLVIGFQCRITVISIFPAWGLYGLLTGRFRQLIRSPSFVLLSLAFGAFVVLWVKWVSGYASYEVNADGRGDGVSWRNIFYFVDLFQEFFLNGNGMMLFASLVLLCFDRTISDGSRFWLAWLLSSILFKMLMPTTPEARHFLLALPAFTGIGLCWFSRFDRSFIRQGLGLVLVMIAYHLARLPMLPNGLTGYEPTATRLAEATEPGNVFLACPHDQDLIFRYRSHAPDSRRLMIRSDRTLATRVAEYARKEAKPHVSTPEEVLEILYRGRVRFVLITLDEGNSPNHFDWQITAETVRKFPDRFQELARYPLRIEFEQPGYSMRVGLYRLAGDLRGGPSDLEVKIPTAGLEIPRPK